MSTGAHLGDRLESAAAAVQALASVPEEHLAAMGLLTFGAVRWVLVAEAAVRAAGSFPTGKDNARAEDVILGDLGEDLDGVASGVLVLLENGKGTREALVRVLAAEDHVLVGNLELV